MERLFQPSHDPATARSQFDLLSLIASAVIVLADREEVSDEAEPMTQRAASARLYSYMNVGEDRGLAPGRWMGDLFREDVERGTDNHARFMADAEALAKLVVGPAIWSLWSDFSEWPEWYEVVERIHSMRGLTHGDAASVITTVQYRPEFGIRVLPAPHLAKPNARAASMENFRWTLAVRSMCEEEAHARRQRVSADRLEALISEEMSA